MEKQILSTVEAAEFTGYSLNYIRRLVSQGKIPHLKPNGGRVFFRRSELESWLTRGYRPVVEEGADVTTV